MKKFCLLLLSCALIKNLQAQSYQLPVRELVDSFCTMHANTEKKDDFFTRLVGASTWFTAPTNVIFSKAVSSLAKDKKISIDTAARMVYDTVVITFINTRMWDEFPGQPAKDSVIFNLYNNGLCDCVTKALSDNKKKWQAEDGIQKCMTALVGDSAYSNSMRRAAEGRPMEDIMELSGLAGRYSIQHCPAWRSYFLGFLHTITVDMYADRYFDNLRNADMVLYHLYLQKSPKEVAGYFPAYKKYESHIRKAAAVKGDIYSLETRDGKRLKEGQLTFTRTFYKYANKKPVLTGQVIYVTDEAKPATPLVSIVFITAANIKNKEKLVKELSEREIQVELPPPPPPGF